MGIRRPRPTDLRPAAVVVAFALASAGCGGSGHRSRSATEQAATIGALVANTAPSGQAAFLGPVRQVKVGGITMGYRQFGSGPSLLLIAGEDSSMVEWGPSLPRLLAAHFRVTEFDNRGVGWSTDQPSRPLTIELMADDTARLIGVLGLRKPVVVGWSTGGEIALTMAVRHPGAAGALVLSGATAGGPTSLSPDFAGSGASRPRSFDVGNLLDTLFPASARADALTYAAGLLAIPTETISRRILRRQGQAEIRYAKTYATLHGLPHIHIPTLVTAGGQDRMVPPANARQIARGIPGARLAIFADAAHMMMFQDSARFVRLVVTQAARIH